MLLSGCCSTGQTGWRKSSHVRTSPSDCGWVSTDWFMLLSVMHPCSVSCSVISSDLLWKSNLIKCSFFLLYAVSVYNDKQRVPPCLHSAVSSLQCALYPSSHLTHHCTQGNTGMWLLPLCLRESVMCLLFCMWLVCVHVKLWICHVFVV